MTSHEYRDAIARLGLSQVKAGELLVCNPRTSRRWASGESPVPRSVALLLQLMVRHNLTADDVLRDTQALDWVDDNELPTAEDVRGILR